MKHVDRFKEVATDYGHMVDFLTVYIREAHPTDGWHFKSNRYQLANAETVEDRIQAAEILEQLGLGTSLVCDNMANDLCRKFNAWPERIYAIKSGVVVYKGGLGPFGYDINDLEQFLKKTMQQ